MKVITRTHTFTRTFEQYVARDYKIFDSARDCQIHDRVLLGEKKCKKCRTTGYVVYPISDMRMEAVCHQCNGDGTYKI